MSRSLTPHSDRSVALSTNMRTSLAWNQLPTRRRQIPNYVSTLRRTDLRPFSCATCRKSFVDISDMRKHVLITHTGIKPVACEICGRRFDSATHKRSHYQLHKEPRLQEFGILSRRRQRQARSEGAKSVLSSTTIGSFHGVPKKKTYMWGPASEKTYGTNQTFHVSETDSDRRVRKEIEKNIRDDAGKDANRHANRTNNGKEGPGKQGRDEKNKNMAHKGKSNGTEAANTKSKKVPQLDGGSISVVGSVVGMTKLVETDKQSGFVEQEEDRLIKARMEAASRAVRTQKQRPEPRLSALPERGEFRLPSMSSKPSGGRFWDTSSLASMRMSGFSTPGYDPAVQATTNPRQSQPASYYRRT